MIGLVDWDSRVDFRGRSFKVRTMYWGDPLLYLPKDLSQNTRTRNSLLSKENVCGWFARFNSAFRFCSSGRSGRASGRVQRNLKANVCCFKVRFRFRTQIFDFVSRSWAHLVVVLSCREVSCQPNSSVWHSRFIFILRFPVSNHNDCSNDPLFLKLQISIVWGRVVHGYNCRPDLCQPHQ